MTLRRHSKTNPTAWSSRRVWHFPFEPNDPSPMFQHEPNDIPPDVPRQTQSRGHSAFPTRTQPRRSTIDLSRQDEPNHRDDPRPSDGPGRRPSGRSPHPSRDIFTAEARIRTHFSRPSARSPSARVAPAPREFPRARSADRDLRRGRSGDAAEMTRQTRTHSLPDGDRISRPSPPRPVPTRPNLARQSCPKWPPKPPKCREIDPVSGRNGAEIDQNGAENRRSEFTLHNKPNRPEGFERGGELGCVESREVGCIESAKTHQSAPGGWCVFADSTHLTRLGLANLNLILDTGGVAGVPSSEPRSPRRGRERGRDGKGDDGKGDATGKGTEMNWTGKGDGRERGRR